MDCPTYPNFPGKHAHDAMFSPRDNRVYRQRIGRLPEWPTLTGAILCYQKSLFSHVREKHAVEHIDGSPFGSAQLLAETGGRVAVFGDFGIGAPVATVVLEELIAFGVRQFVSIGTAGALSKQLRIGDLVVCDRAIRDEGVSHHYLPPAKYAEASPGITDNLEQAMRQRGLNPLRGTSWTIDTPFRETVAEARHYQAEGVLTVEMEAAALFAVSRYREVELAAAFTISDSLAELVWDLQFHAPPTQSGLEQLLQAAIDTLLAEREH